MYNFFFFQAEDGIRDRSPSRGLGDVYKRQDKLCIGNMHVGPGKEVTGDVHVYMDEKDKDDLRAIRAKGVDVYIQIAPGDHKLDFEK